MSGPLPAVCAGLAGGVPPGALGDQGPHRLSCPALGETVACAGAACPSSACLSPACFSPASGVWGREIRRPSLVLALPPAPCGPLAEPLPLLSLSFLIAQRTL